jgi:hypothetical protein
LAAAGIRRFEMTCWANYCTEEKVVTMVNAVRQALSALGDVSNEDLAAYIKTTFGITVRPNFMPVMRAAVKDKANLELWRERSAGRDSTGTEDM